MFVFIYNVIYYTHNPFRYINMFPTNVIRLRIAISDKRWDSDPLCGVTLWQFLVAAPSLQNFQKDRESKPGHPMGILVIQAESKTW